MISFAVSILTVILGAVFNGGYFLSRYPAEVTFLQETPYSSGLTTTLPSIQNARDQLTRRRVLSQQIGNPSNKSHDQSRYYFISQNSRDYPRLIKDTNLFSVTSYHGYDFLVKSVTGGIILDDISGYTEKESLLFSLSLISLLFVVVTIFFVTRLLISRSLKNLTLLEDYTNHLDSETLTPPLVFSNLIATDPIQKLAQAISHFHTAQFAHTENIKQFMSSVAHEINTPLQVIQTKVDLELAQHPSSKNLTTIEKQVSHINDLIHILSTLTYADYQKLPLETVAVEKIIQQVITTFEEKYPDYRRHYSHSRGSIQKQANTTSLITIISNLLQNAVKYSPPGSEISISLTSDFCQITDTGKGIESQALQHIRDPFRQADTSRGKDTGFGLGLTLVKKLTELHGRHITCTSKLGEGTSFIISR